MASILDELFGNATGFKRNLLEDPLSTDLESPDAPVTRKAPEDSYSDPYTKGLYRFDPNTGKKITGEAVFENVSNSNVLPKKKPNDLESIAKSNPGMFERIFGMSTDQFSKNWSEKGGYEGLMANPAFLLGLGIMQSSAQGKPIGSDIFDIAVKSGAVSAQYADRIKARQKLIAPVTAAQRDEVKAVLAESNLGSTADVSTKIKNLFKGKNTEALNTRALDDIYMRAEQMMKADAEKYGGRTVRSRREYFEQAVKDLQRENKIEVSEKGFMNWLFGRGVQSTAKGLAKGGPVKESKEYIVGEEGPEMFVPEVDGNIIKNDDAKVINMLLESNPQLKNVSRARAVKILKARFPDYF